MTDRRDEALARSMVYRLLSRSLLKEPTVSFLTGLAEQVTLRVLAKVGGQWMATLQDRDLEALAEELATEYARLFVGPGRHVYPYESMHASIGADGEGPDANLYGKTAVAVSEFYQEAGVAPSPSFRGLPDHIGVELECMSHLSAREAQAWKRGDTEGAISSLLLQRAFLRRHLVPWLPVFARRVRRFAAHPFYCSMATAAARFVRVDWRTVDDLLKDRQVPDEEIGELSHTATSLRSYRRQ